MAQVAAGELHTCARGAGEAYCWGANASGQLGLNSTTPSLVAVKVPISGPKNVVDISTGKSHTCMRRSGEVWCWGENASGQVGNNATTDVLAPVKLGTLASMVEVAAGGAHSCARKNDNTISCWGSNTPGQLGDNGVSGGTSLVPVAVFQMTAAAGLATGGSHTCTFLQTEITQCWGENGDGQIGNNATVDRQVPTTSNLTCP
jgi:alpha-tubulin suppressor-like RCC1 family protein